MCIVPTVFVSCYNHVDTDGEIYAAQVKHGEAGLDFHKIVSGIGKTGYIFGIGHLENQNKLYFTALKKGIYTCDYTGANKRLLLTGDPGKYWDRSSIILVGLLSTLIVQYSC